MNFSLLQRGAIARSTALLPLALSGLGLGACDSGTKAPQTASSVAPIENEQWAQDRLKKAIGFLNTGDSDRARSELVKLLNARPGNALARKLLAQIDSDPKQLLGVENHSYTARDDESLSELAQRFLGDPMLAYALARYNGLASPQELKPGQKLLIPGKRKAAPRIATRRSAPERATPKSVAAEPRTAGAAKVAPTSPQAAQASPAKPAPTGANPAQAARLRGQGLAAMNGGAINRAVVLLRQALSFDPGNALIRNDLARAMRIRGTLAARR